MSDKPGKAKKAKKSAKAQPSVLGSLPATRPERIGRRTPAGKAKPAAPKPPRTRPAAAPKPKPVAAKRAAAKPKPTPVPPPRPERPPARPPSGPELVTTGIRAAGELAQIGLSAGGRAIRRAARRIPRP
jgi:hypothetical protein